MPKHALRISGFIGFLAVLLGAFGAHLLKSRISAELLTVFQTGVHYHLAHAIALLAVVLSGQPLRRVFTLWIVGISIFSGTLYLYAITGQKFFAMITPLGGLCLMAGWLSLVFQSKDTERNAD
ncbi:MAG: DUF423 domain-containing protein [Fimbriimonadaceae bacterium]